MLILVLYQFSHLATGPFLTNKNTNTLSFQLSQSSPTLCSTLLIVISTKLYSPVIISCPAGWVATEEGGCTDDNECISDPCNNGGTCINLDNGQGFLCVCQNGYTGDICHLPVQEKMISLASNTFAVIILFVIVNAIGKAQENSTIYNNLCST